jgi:hypothetical protein
VAGGRVVAPHRALDLQGGFDGQTLVFGESNSRIDGFFGSSLCILDLSSDSRYLPCDSELLNILQLLHDNEE